MMEKQVSRQNKCFTCGLSNHVFLDCKFKTYRCKLCKSVGHLAKICDKNKNYIVNVEENEEIINMCKV